MRKSAVSFAIAVLICAKPALAADFEVIRRLPLPKIGTHNFSIPGTPCVVVSDQYGEIANYLVDLETGKTLPAPGHGFLRATPDGRFLVGEHYRRLAFFSVSEVLAGRFQPAHEVAQLWGSSVSIGLLPETGEIGYRILDWANPLREWGAMVIQDFRVATDPGAFEPLSELDATCDRQIRATGSSPSTLSRDGRMIAAEVGLEQLVRIFEVNDDRTCTLSREVPLPNYPNELEFSPDGKQLAYYVPRDPELRRLAHAVSLESGTVTAFDGGPTLRHSNPSFLPNGDVIYQQYGNGERFLLVVRPGA
jgi:hypothetical protein